MCLIGKENVGKSKISSWLTGVNLPNAFYIKTQGINIREKSNNDQSIYIIDTKGSDAAIQFDFPNQVDQQ